MALHHGLRTHRQSCLLTITLRFHRQSTSPPPWATFVAWWRLRSNATFQEHAEAPQLLDRAWSPWTVHSALSMRLWSTISLSHWSHWPTARHYSWTAKHHASLLNAFQMQRIHTAYSTETAWRKGRRKSSRATLWPPPWRQIRRKSSMWWTLHEKESCLLDCNMSMLIDFLTSSFATGRSCS